MFNRLILSILLISNSLLCFAETENEGAEGKKTTFKDRFAIHTNSVEWVLMTPNIGFEFDVVHNNLKKQSILLSARYNWAANQDFIPDYIYNILGGKIEYRWYWRTRKRENWEKEWINTVPGFFNKLLTQKELITGRNNPRRHRAYYIGPYVSFDKFTTKFSETGYQGIAISGGATFGFNTSLYRYNNGSAIDLEIGASAGILYASGDKFTANHETNCYAYVGEQKGSVLPIISDVSVSLIYRMKSIDEQILDVDTKKFEEMQKASKYREEYLRADSAFKDHDSIDVWNQRIEEKNKLIEKFNKELSKKENVDSADYMEYLRPIYRYARIPEKILSFGYKKSLPNMDVTSTEELDDKFINTLVEDYELIESDSIHNVQSVSEQIIASYGLVREKMIINLDSVSRISYLEFLSKAVPQINQSCIDAYHAKYIAEFDTTIADATIIEGSSKLNIGSSEKGIEYYPIHFIETKLSEDGKRRDITFVLIDSIPDVIKSENEEIEARNKLRQIKYEVKTYEEEPAEEILEDIATDVTTVATDSIRPKTKAELKAERKAAKKAEKEAKKAAKAKAKAEKKAKEEAENTVATNDEENKVATEEQNNIEQATEEQNDAEQTAEEQENAELATEEQNDAEQTAEEQENAEQATEEQNDAEQTAEEQENAEQATEEQDNTEQEN